DVQRSGSGADDNGHHRRGGDRHGGGDRQRFAERSEERRVGEESRQMGRPDGHAGAGEQRHGGVASTGRRRAGFGDGERRLHGGQHGDVDGGGCGEHQADRRYGDRRQVGGADGRDVQRSGSGADDNGHHRRGSDRHGGGDRQRFAE